jgi:hypothetical protein
LPEQQDWQFHTHHDADPGKKDNKFPILATHLGYLTLDPGQIRHKKYKPGEIKVNA